MLGVCLKTAFHPKNSLQSFWELAQLGLLIFPLSPLFGAIGLIVAVLGTWMTQYRTIIKIPLNWGFAFLSVLLFICVGFADNKQEAFLGLFNFLPYFFIFAGFSALIQTTTQLRQLSWILVMTSLPVIVIGLGQLFLGWANSQGWAAMFGWAVAPGGEPPGRMSSIFMYANTLAGYLMIVFILALGLWVDSYQQIKRQGYKGHQQGSYLHFLFLTVAVIANFVALILTNSRNAWAIAVFACLAYALYQGWRILVAGVVGIAISVLLAAFAPSPIAQFFRKVVPTFFWARLNDQLYPDRPIALLRTTQWQFALSLTQQRPWTGWGLRNFTPLYQAKMNIWLGHPHSLFLMLSAEAGLPTTLLFCGLLGWMLIAGVQLLRTSKSVNTDDKTIFFSYLVVLISLVLFNTVDVSLFDFRLNVISWLVLGAIAGVTYHDCDTGCRVTGCRG
jgi:O-antigen ligase